MADKNIDLDRTLRTLVNLIRPETEFIKVVVVYGVAISLLTLAVPIAVQTLINTVANIQSLRAIVVLSGVLCLVLVVSGILNALRIHIMELYERKVYARLTSQISMKTILAEHKVFEGQRNSTITQRYFEVMTLQKNIPSLVIDGTALVLQMLVGFTLVSFYHPMLFVFNLIVLIFIYSIWKIWSRGAKRTAIQLSHAKYETARWLSELSRAHEFVKSSRHLDFAGQNTDAMVDRYVKRHKGHFKYTFAQTLAFLALYAVASAMLLGIGGWLVIRNELSIGQLVAAELIMSAVFFGMSQYTSYLKEFYELYGAADKIGQVLSLPQEKFDDVQVAQPNDSTLQFDEVVIEHLGRHCEVSFTVEAGAKVYLTTDMGWIQRSLINLLKLNEKPKSGAIRLGGFDLNDYDVYELRQAVFNVDRSLIVECTVKEYLRLSAPDASLAAMNDALEEVGLAELVKKLPQGLDTRMSSLGSPLMPLDLVLLKLAAAFLAKPSVVILNQHFDSIPQDAQMRLLAIMRDKPFSIIYFTNHANPPVFDEELTFCTNGNSTGGLGLTITRKGARDE